jgi:hypothetical protein
MCSSLGLFRIQGTKISYLSLTVTHYGGQLVKVLRFKDTDPTFKAVWGTLTIFCMYFSTSSERLSLKVRSYDRHSAADSNIRCCLSGDAKLRTGFEDTKCVLLPIPITTEILTHCHSVQEQYGHAARQVDAYPPRSNGNTPKPYEHRIRYALP